MADYFYTEEKLEQLYAEMEEWRGTPYRHRCSKKGLGADCIGFVVGVLTAIGYKKKWKMPAYPKDWHLHNMESLLLNEVRAQMNSDLVPLTEDRKNGDILLYHFGKTTSHAGIVYNKWIYHSVIGTGVERFQVDDPMWAGRERYNVRLLCLQTP